MKKRNVLVLVSMCALAMVGCSSEIESEPPTVMNASWTNTNPELFTIYNDFTRDMVWADSTTLSEKDKYLIAIVSLVVQQSQTLLPDVIQDALDVGVSAEEIQEAIYQCGPYCGYPRTIDAAVLASTLFAENGITVPLSTQTTVTEETRFEKGLDAQAGIFGDVMRQIAANPEISRSSYYLVENCFGDHYTRSSLDLETREMLTLIALVNLGTESQIMSHIRGNFNMGRSIDEISDMIYQCLPYAGYPRLLNTLNIFNSVVEEVQSDS